MSVVVCPSRATLWTDFHWDQDDGRISAIFKGRRPEIGEPVLLSDDCGHYCFGTVESHHPHRFCIVKTDPLSHWWLKIEVKP